MKKPLIILVMVIIAVGAFFGWDYFKRNIEVDQVKKLQQMVERPFDKYTYDALTKTDFAASEIIIGKVIFDNPTFVSRMFYFYVGAPRTRSGVFPQLASGQAGQANSGQACIVRDSGNR